MFVKMKTIFFRFLTITNKSSFEFDYSFHALLYPKRKHRASPNSRNILNISYQRYQNNALLWFHLLLFTVNRKYWQYCHQNTNQIRRLVNIKWHHKNLLKYLSKTELKHNEKYCESQNVDRKLWPPPMDEVWLKRSVPTSRPSASVNPQIHILQRLLLSANFSYIVYVEWTN